MKNIIFELALNYLKKSKRFYMMISLTIVVTTMLMTIVGVLAYNLNLHYSNISKGDNGEFEILVKHASKEEVNEISNFDGIDNYSIIENLSTIPTEDGKLELFKTDSNYRKINNVRILEGKYPTEDNEIALEEAFMVSKNYKVGDVYSLGDNSKMKIVGKLSNFKYGDRKNGYRIYLKYTDVIEDSSYDLYIKSKKDNISNIVNKLRVEENIQQDRVKFNTSFSANPEEKSSIFNLIGIILIISVAVYLSINNLYMINFKKRVNDMGMLIMVGTTDKQIKKLFNYEVLTFSTVPILLGMLLGGLCSYKLIPMVELGFKLELSFEYKIFIAIYALMALTILFSIRRIYFKIKTLTPIESIKDFSEINKMSFRKAKNNRNTSVFKDLAISNLIRNKKSTIIMAMKIA